MAKKIGSVPIFRGKENRKCPYFPLFSLCGVINQSSTKKSLTANGVNVIFGYRFAGRYLPCEVRDNEKIRYYLVDHSLSSFYK